MLLTKWITPLLAIVGLYWFSASFFLAKRSLPHSATCEEAFDLLTNVLNLSSDEAELLVASHSSLEKNGCWLPNLLSCLLYEDAFATLTFL